MAAILRSTTAVVLLAVLALAGCSEAEDAVRSATTEAEREARTAAGQAATEVVRGQICQVAEDGRISEAEIAVLRTALARARRARVGVAGGSVLVVGRSGAGTGAEQVEGYDVAEVTAYALSGERLRVETDDGRVNIARFVPTGEMALDELRQRVRAYADRTQLDVEDTGDLLIDVANAEELRAWNQRRPKRPA